MKRGKDKQPRAMSPASLANLRPLPRVLPLGMERVKVDVFLTPMDARLWRRLAPGERGERIADALRRRERGE